MMGELKPLCEAIGHRSEAKSTGPAADRNLRSIVESGAGCENVAFTSIGHGSTGFDKVSRPPIHQSVAYPQPL